MKSEISSLELHYLAREFQELLSAKVEQIYQIGREELIIQLHIPGKGKRILRCVLGSMIYIASNKGDVPEKPPGFCLYLRRKLKNARLRSVRQLGFERIVEFMFETKDAKFILMIELFSKGNIILCDEERKILSVLERQEWKDRSVKPGETYTYPAKEFNFLTIDKDDLTNLLHRSQKESLVKALAIELGLGGVYAEELCLLAGIDKNLKPAQLSDKEISSLHEAIQAIRDKELSPTIYKFAEGQIKDIVPFGLEFYRSFQQTSADTFNSALDSVLTEKIEKKDIDTAEKAAKTKLDKVEEVIRQQRLRIDGLERSAEENQRKAEFIYENYQLIERVIAEINEEKSQKSWKEIKEMFKGHKMIKGIDTKTGEITIEL